MSENPTAEGGASIVERIERYLSAEDPAPQAEQAQETPQEAPEAPEAPEAQPTDTAEPESDVQAESDEPQISTSDLARFFGADESAFDLDDDGNVVIKTKIDGKEGTAKFAELVKNYQLQGHAENKAREAAEFQRAIQQRAAEMEQAAQARMQQIEAMANIAQNELFAEFQSIDWNTLRQIDAGEYAAKQADFAQRNQKIQAVLQNAQQQRAQADYINQQRFGQFLAEQASQLPTLIPEWADTSVASKEKGEIKEWGLKAGIDPVFLESVSSAPLVKALRDAMLYQRGQQDNAQVEKKVRAAPKLVRAGSPVSAQDKQAQTLQGLKAQIKKSGGKDGIAEYLLATGKV